MNARAEIAAACGLWLLMAAIGCRSTASPTFAVGGTVPPAGVANQHRDSRGQTGTAVPAQPVGVGGPEAIVQSPRQELPPSRESPFAKLLGTFHKPRRIPLPRTDLPAESGPSEVIADEPPATDLAEAF